jgi:CBS domain containing-hemolysin-like protein
MVVNLFFASIMDRVVARAALRFSLSHAWLYSVAVGTVLVLVFGEMTPKNVAVRNPVSFFAAVSHFLYPVHLLLTPVRTVLRAVERSIVAMVSGRLDRGRDSAALVRAAVLSGVKRGIIHASEQAILDRFMDLRERTVGDVLIPRTHLECVEAGTTLEELLRDEDILAEGRPVTVYAGDLDHIVGYVSAEDVLDVGAEGVELRTVGSIVRTSHPVPRSKNTLELFQELMGENSELAVVVDEYGGTAGVVTYQLLLQQLLEAYEPSSAKPLGVENDGVVTVPAETPVEELERAMEVVIGGESRTIGGAVIDACGEIPAEGKRVELGEIVAIVERASSRRVLEVRIRRPS